MEFTVNKSDLVRELSLSQGVVEKRTTIPILSNVLIEAGGDRLVLTATDLELGIRFSCPAKVSKSGAGTIPARRLLDYVQLLPDADINVKFGENQWASLLCGRSRNRIPGMDWESFPKLPEMPEVLAEIPVAALASMIPKTIFAISSQETRFSLRGALLLVKSHGLTMVATDAHRLSLVDYPMADYPLSLPEGFQALLRRRAMAEILRLSGEADPDAKIRFSENGNHLFFQVGDRLLMIRKITGNFPQFERVLPKGHQHAATIPRDEFRSAIERVSQSYDKSPRDKGPVKIRLQVCHGELKLSCKSEIGESEESVPAVYDGEPVEVGCCAQYLLDFLRAVSSDEVVFRFKDGNSTCELRPVGEAEYSYRYIVMPMKLEG